MSQLAPEHYLLEFRFRRAPRPVAHHTACVITLDVPTISPTVNRKGLEPRL